MLSFERRQMDTVISSYEAVGLNVKAQIERALFLGKPLANFIGMGQVLAKAKKNSEDLKNVGILDKTGKGIYSLDQSVLVVPNDLRRRLGKETSQTSQHVQVGQIHYLLFSLKDDDAKVRGYLLFTFDDNILAAKRQRIAEKSSFTLLTCSLFAALVLITGFTIVRKPRHGLQTKPLMWLIIMVLGLSQLVTSYYYIQFFKADYLDLLQVKARTTAALTAQDIDSLLHKGLKLTTLFNIEKQLAGVVDSVPEVAGLAITNNDNKVLYHQGEPFEPMSADLSLPLTGNNEAVGHLCMKTNHKVVAGAVQEIALDSITIVLLSMLFCVELLGFLLSLMQGGTLPAAVADQTLSPGIGMVRTAAFLYIFAASLSISFIPLHMKALYQPVPGFSKQMILGFPIALEMLGGGLILIPAGAWIDRRGWHHPFVVGVLLSFIGAVWSGLAVNHFHFMAARLMAGVGYGLGWMSVQGFVLHNTPLNQRARGISSIVAGIFAGIICGNGMGALVAQRLGFAQVFLMGGMGMGIVLLLVLTCLRSTFTVPKTTTPDHTGSIHSFIRLLKDPQALIIFACSLVPYSIVMVGLLYYITPLFLSGAGVSQSDIGRVIMLFGLSMIFIAPQVSRLADKLGDKRWLMFGGGIIGGGCLLPFYFSAGLWIVVASVLFFGFSVSISGASRNVLTLNLPVAQQIGSSRVMGIYRSIDKLGQMLGALIPAALMTWLSIPDTMLVMGGVYLVLTVILIAGVKRQAG